MTRMTIGKLKEIIKDLPDDMEVVIADSEWGDEYAIEAEVITDHKNESYLRISQ